MKAIELNGSETSCKVFVDATEDNTEAQIRAMLESPAFTGCQVRIMPDVHAGAGCVIGFTSPVGPGVCPNVIGVDIGCGVIAARIGQIDIDFAALDAHIRAHVPSGFSLRERIALEMGRLYDTMTQRPFQSFADAVAEIAARIEADLDKVWRSIGTLGGGNHFIEVDEDESGDKWLTLHSGSRNFGLRVANMHQKIAKAATGDRHGLEYLTGGAADDYLRDMRIAQTYAELNRAVMLSVILEFFGLDELDCRVVESVHNFIGPDNVIRKGAISARAGEDVVIPWNMRDGLIIGRGRGNPDWNYSAPHGAGRRMGRMQAKRTLNVDDFTRQMRDAGIWSSCVDRDTLDEAPDAYKPFGEVEKWLGETVEVTHRLRPLYNFKAQEVSR